MKNLYTTGLITLVLSISCSAHAAPATGADHAAPPDRSNMTRIDLKPQAWQVRRQAFALAANTLRQNPNDDKARQAVELTVAAYNKNPISYTPMEAMEILGAIHLHKDGILKAMPLIVMEAVFGWYDALQWGSETGQKEIERNERLFTRALQIGGGNKAVNDWAELLEKDPQTAIRIVDEGIARATRLHAKDKTAYDHKWPSAYSLERTLAVMAGKPEPVVNTPNLPSARAWKEAVEYVRNFYIPLEK
jgi:hypothetical protein